MTKARLLFAACFVLALLALGVLVYLGQRAAPAPLLPETPPGSAGIVGTATADPSYRRLGFAAPVNAPPAAAFLRPGAIAGRKFF